MTDTSRGESWLNNRAGDREEAIALLAGNGEDPNSRFWGEVLDNLYPTSEEEESKASDEVEQQQQREQQDNEDTFRRVGKFIRRVLRGLI